MAQVPAYAQSFLPASVTSRPLNGDVPTVDLVLDYRKSNQSPILKLCFRDWTSWLLGRRRRSDKISLHILDRADLERKASTRFRNDRFPFVPGLHTT
jgi:hypothetical protein